MKMEQSMSRKGNCWEWLPLGYNAPTERFFRSLKHEQLNYEKFRAKGAAKLNILDVWLFTMENVHTQTDINRLWNLNVHFIGRLPEKVSGFY